MILDIQQCSVSYCCWLELEVDIMELDECGGFGGSGSGGGVSDIFGFFFDQEWKFSLDEFLRNFGCFGLGVQYCCCSSIFSQFEVVDQFMGYVSDFFCNSLDGVLVIFSIFYNKMYGIFCVNFNFVLQF